MKFCHNCGKEIADNRQACPYCGINFVNTEPPAGDSQTSGEPYYDAGVNQNDDVDPGAEPYQVGNEYQQENPYQQGEPYQQGDQYQQGGPYQQGNSYQQGGPYQQYQNGGSYQGGPYQGGPYQGGAPYQGNGYYPVQKSKVLAGVLGILLGSLGVHNFYLGYTGKAVCQLLMSVLSCGLLAIVSEIWGLVEGIMILTGSIGYDAQGVPLRD